MNARASRRRRRERAHARAAGETRLAQETHELVVRLRIVRDQRLADNGRRRREDIAQLEDYYRAERRAIWEQYHGVMQAIRDGKQIVFAAPEVIEETAPHRSRGWFRRLFRRKPTAIPVEVSG